MSGYFGPDRRPIRLGKKLGEGAGGSIFAIVDHGHLAAKIWHRPSGSLAERVLKMIELAVPAQVPGAQATVAWPVALLFDSRRRAVGFMMPLAPGPSPVTLYQLMLPAERERFVKNFSWRRLAWIAHNVAAAYAHLAGHGIVVADINESNVVVAGDGQITIIDPDSMQFVDRSGKVWLSGYHKPDYLAPELEGVALATTPRRPEHDNYAGSVLLFQIVMEGFHPHDGRRTDGSSPTLFEIARAGGFAYPRNDRRFHPPPGAPPWEVLPPELQQLMVRAFTAGTKATKRPSAQEWQQTLRVAAGQLRLCSGPRQHYFPIAAPHCAWCARLGITSQPGFAPAALFPGRQPAPMPQTPVTPKPPATATPATPSPAPPAKSSSAGRRKVRLWARLSRRARSTVAAGVICIVLAGAAGPADYEGSSAAEAPIGPAVAGADALPEQTRGRTSDRVARPAGVAPSPPKTQPPRKHDPQRLGPAGVIRQHFHELSEGNVGRAFALFSTTYQARNPSWVRLRREARPYLKIVSVGSPRINGTSAFVFVRFFAQDSLAVPGSDTKCRVFSGSAHLRRENGTWRYDPLPGQPLHAQGLPAGSPNCPIAV